MAKKKMGVTKKSTTSYKGGSSDLDPLTKSGKQTFMTRQGKLPSGKRYLVSVNKTEEELHGGANYKSSSSSHATYNSKGTKFQSRPGLEVAKSGHKRNPGKVTEGATIKLKSTKKK